MGVGSQTRTLGVIDIGVLADRKTARIARGAALIVLFSLITVGLLRLSYFVPNYRMMAYGLYPFITGNVIKLYISAITFPFAWRLLNLKQPLDEQWT